MGSKYSFGRISAKSAILLWPHPGPLCAVIAVIAKIPAIAKMAKIAKTAAIVKIARII